MENKDHEQTNKSGSSGLHSLVSEGALFTFCSSSSPLPPSLLLLIALSLCAQKGLNGHKPPAGQSQLK